MSSIGSEVINGLEDAIFGSVPNETITSTPDPFEEFDPFADDAFFYPRVIHDSEPCKWLIQHKISHINIRLWDLLFFVPNSTFLSFLMFGYSKSKQRLKGITGNSNGLIVLYYLVVIMTASCVTRSLINMLLTMEAESSTSEKVGWVFTKFVYLAAEVCIIIITSCFGWIGKNGIYISLIIGTVISLWSAASNCIWKSMFHITDIKWFTQGLIYMVMVVLLITVSCQQYLQLPTFLSCSFHVYQKTRSGYKWLLLTIVTASLNLFWISSHFLVLS